MLFILFLIHSLLFPHQIYINEVVSDNDNVVYDFEGDNPDWVELYNPNDFPVDLYDYSLSDKASDPIKWTFPEVTMPPKSYLIVFCSGKNTIVNGEVHTNFSISSTGETLYLYDNNPIIMQRKRLDVVEIPPLRENKAYGKLPDGNGKLSYLSTNSPGETNHFSDEIICSVESGFYETDTIEVELTSAMGYEIRYTLDGKDPDENSPLYTLPIKLGNSSDKPNKYCEIVSTPPESYFGDFFHHFPKNNINKLTILKYRSFNLSKEVSDCFYSTYYINDTFEFENIPIISLALDSSDLFSNENGIYVPGIYYDSTNSGWSGNYYHLTSQEEKKAHFTYFDENKNYEYSQNVTINIVGGGSRVYAQKSIKVNGRNLNGTDELYFDLNNAKTNEYKHIKLKSSYGVWSQTNIWQNEMGSEIAQTLNFEKLNYRPALLFLNGEYWGIYTITEHKNKDYLSQFHDLHRDSIDIVMHHYTTPDFGNGDNYSSLVDFMENNSLEVENNYNYIESKIDISSFIDYYLYQIIIRNMDWPFANMLAWKPRSENAKWRWILYDLDGGFVDDIDYNMFEHLLQNEHDDWPNSRASTLTFRMLAKSELFRKRLYKRCNELINNQFDYERTSRIYFKLRDYYTPYIQIHYERFNYPFNYGDWWHNQGDEYILSFLQNRPAKVLEHLEDFMTISSYDLDLCPDNQCDLNRITFFPNPSNGVFSVNITSKFNLSNLTLYNSVGKVLDTKYNINLTNYTFDYSHLTNGFYFIKFENNLGQYTFEKFIINK